MSRRGQTPSEHTDPQEFRATGNSSSSQLPYAHRASAQTQPTTAFSHPLPPTSMTYAPNSQHYGHHFTSHWIYSVPTSGYPTTRYPYLHRPPPALPEVTGYAPNQATAGQKIYVYLRSYHDLENHTPVSFSIMFQHMAVATELHSIGRDDQFYQYALSASVPDLEAFPDPIQLQLNMQDIDGQSLSYFTFGDFSYVNFHQPLQNLHQAEEPSRKRKFEQTAYSPLSSTTLGSQHQSFEAAPRSREPGLGYASAHPTQSFHTTSLEPTYKVGSPQHAPTRIASSSSIPSMLSVRRRNEDTYLRGRSGDPTSPVRKRSRGPWTQSMSRTASVPSLSTKSSKEARAKDDKSPAASDPGNPRLVRTSTMLNSTGTIAGTQTRQDFNPYSIYPTKVTLEFQSDLEDMLKDWTDEEKSAKRRLVEFERTQTDNVLSVSFKPVAPKDRKPRGICVSCIWWEERQEAFVTSVDTINLLQSLIGARFTVEEKNRTRRNLEGFKPLTVAKSRPESASFFRTIMGFSNPRPRNIEKDVKVFPWSILSLALKKVIAKYSPDYASTAGILAQPGRSDEAHERQLDDDAQSLSPSPSLLPTSEAPSKTPSRQSIKQAPMPTDPVPPLGMYLPHARLPTRTLQVQHHDSSNAQSEEQTSSSWDFDAYLQSGLVATPSLNPDYTQPGQDVADESDLVSHPDTTGRRHL